MLIALVLFGVLTTVGAMTLSMSGADQRVAYNQQRYVQLRYGAHAAIQHARFEMLYSTPPDSGWTTPARGWASTTAVAAWRDGTDWSPIAGPLVPDYQVFYRYERCSTAAPGYSADIGARNQFRTDYWRVLGAAREAMGDVVTLGEQRAIMTKVAKGECHIR
jgi:type II secretory pathway pseudopilin PulG